MAPPLRAARSWLLVLPFPDSWHASPLAPLKEFLERQSAVVLLVPRGVHERDGTSPGLAHQEINRLLLGSQLLPVPPLKLLPPRRIVSEPLAQLWAGSHVLEPQVHRDPCLGQPPRPQPLHKNPFTIGRVGLFIRSLQMNHELMPPSVGLRADNPPLYTAYCSRNNIALRSFEIGVTG